MATFGIILQMCGYFLVFFQPPRQPFLPPVAALSGIAGIAFSVLTVAIAAGSGWLIAICGPNAWKAVGTAGTAG